MTIGQEIIQGLQEAVNYMDGTANKEDFNVHTLSPCTAPSSVDVKAIRKELGLSQSGFASSFGLSLAAIRNWEQGKRQPNPAARAYLTVIAKAPHVVREALQEVQ